MAQTTTLIRMASLKRFGDEVPTVSCRYPVHETIAGRYVELIPTKAEHAESLYETVGGNDKAALYDYMAYGPFNEIAPFKERIAAFENSKDPLFWTIRHLASDRLVGWLSLLRIDTANRVVEIGHIMYAPQLQRTTAATEVWYLLANKVVSRDEGFV